MKNLFFNSALFQHRYKTTENIFVIIFFSCFVKHKTLRAKYCTLHSLNIPYEDCGKRAPFCLELLAGLVRSRRSGDGTAIVAEISGKKNRRQYADRVTSFRQYGQ